MLLRFALVAALLVSPIHAAKPRKAAAAKEAPPPPLRDTERVAINTELGTITLDLDGKHAPISTANFLHYVDTKRFDGIVFYRAMKLTWGEQPNGLIQAGLRWDPRKIFPPIAHEPSSQTGVLHKAGAISMARLAPGTATGDFSILVSTLEGLDADPKSDNAEGQAGYAAFGYVVEGMDVARRIWDQPTDPEKGEGGMKGQMLATPVKVLSVRRVPAMAPTITRP
jgi:peptidyl-prolyl cis-trans isomerase A (cyclophilin A)